jgi:hypothetical protein
MSEGKTTVGILTAFGVGYLVGSQGGREGLDEVVAAAREVKSSDEFADLLRALRTHAGDTLQELGRRLGGASSEPLSIVTLLERARGKATKDTPET